MLSKRTFRYCENCNAPHEYVCPATIEDYENGMIEIVDGTLFLPEKVATKIAHTISINGIYCNVDCLVKKIKKALSPKKAK